MNICGSDGKTGNAGTLVEPRIPIGNVKSFLTKHSEYFLTNFQYCDIMATEKGYRQTVSPEKLVLKELTAKVGRLGGYFFFIATIVYKMTIKITVMYSIGNAPFRGQDSTAYRLW